MRVINFLPEDYLRRKSARRANLVCGLIGAGALVVLGGVLGLMALESVKVTRARLAIDRRFDDAGRQIKQMKDLEDRKAGLLHKVEVSASLLERVPRSYLLAHLANNLPPHTSLTSLAMTTVEVEEAAPPPAADEEKPKDEKATNKGGGGKKKPPPKVKVKRVQLTLGGLAPTDVDVAEYIGRLCADPAFQEIELRFSEEFPYKENVRMRRFEIVLKVNPKAEEFLERSAAPKVLTAALAAPPPSPRPAPQGEPEKRHAVRGES